MVYFNYIALHLGLCSLLLAVGETIQVGNFDPKIATFWIDSGKMHFVFAAYCLIFCSLSPFHECCLLRDDLLPHRQTERSSP